MKRHSGKQQALVRKFPAYGPYFGLSWQRIY